MKKSAIGCGFPDAIVEDILSRLHSKTLVKLRIVCKKWKTLISTCYFRRLHNEKSLKHPNVLLFRDSSSHDSVLTTVSLDGDELDQWDLPLPSGLRLNMLPSQWGPNNILCFVVDRKRFYVCNPSVRKLIYLPQQQYKHDLDAYGFCYLPIMNQYVVISASRNQWQMINFSYSNTLTTGGWKSIQNNTPLKHFDCPDGVFVNGFLYWTGRIRSSLWTDTRYWRWLPGAWNPCFLCFDLYEEKFYNVAYPNGVKVYTSTLHDINGDLHMFSDSDSDYPSATSMTLWKLDDVQNQTWIKQYTIDLPNFYYTPLVVDADGEMLVHEENFLVWYSTKDEVVEIRRKGGKSIGNVRTMKNTQLHTDTLLMS